MMFSGMTKGLGLAMAAAAAIALAPVVAQAGDYRGHRVYQEREYGSPKSFQVADSRRYRPGRRHHRRLRRGYGPRRHGGNRRHYYYERHSHHGSILGALIIGTVIGAMLDAPDSGPDYVVTPAAPAAPPPAVFEQTPEEFCREYQTTVIVGGEQQTAYGTACRQPDGSWRRIAD